MLQRTNAEILSELVNQGRTIHLSGQAATLMFEYRVDFNSPWFLTLLAVIPLMWWLSFRGLSGLGRWRRLFALGFRTLVWTLLVLAAAEAQMVRTSERLAVIYLLDQSESIPVAQRRAMIQYVNTAITEQREGTDYAGVVVFGREAAIEVPPFDDDVQIPSQLETEINSEHTNLAGAIKLAQAAFPAGAAKRIVLISDGNQNLGQAEEQARAAMDSGIGIDVHPILYQTQKEVAVEKLSLPPDVRKGQVFDLRVVLNNSTQPTAEDDGHVKGKLVISQVTDDQPVVLSEQQVDLPPGKKVFTVRQQIDEPHFYTYQARFVPDDPADDRMVQNNSASTFTHVRGSGQVLLIEDQDARGEHDVLVERLRADNLEVTIRASNQLFKNLTELQQYDSVILANVPREDFTDDQLKMLTVNTQDLGAGLLMLGGPNSCGAGGWTNSPIEEAMPVDFQIKSAKVMPKGALALVMHACEMPNGNHWEKVIAKKAIETLGSEDYCGLWHYSTPSWLWGGIVRVGDKRPRMLRMIDTMTPGDMPDFDQSMRDALRAFSQVQDAAAKHMIVISDGDPAPPAASIIAQLKAQKVTITTVIIGSHGFISDRTMRDMSKATGGNHYAPKSGSALPRIFQKEARRIARPLVYEPGHKFIPQIKTNYEIISGIDGPLPPITGYVRTSAKQNPLVEISLVSPEPGGSENPILASWTYGLGKTAVFTTDVGTRWAKDWPAWSNYDKLFTTMVRWSLRPSGDEGKFTVSTDVEDGKVKVFVTALDKNDEFLNFLDLQGGAVGPDMKPRELQLEQTAPGRYVGTFDGNEAGSYLLTLSSGAGKTPIRTGVNVPYSAEFRDREANEALLMSLASLTPMGGEPGKVIQVSTNPANTDLDVLEQLLQVNTYRHDLAKATSSQDIWQYLLVLAAVLFFLDVFIRRVTVHFGWVAVGLKMARDKLLGRPMEAAPTATMARLRNRKAQISEHLDQQRAQTRFEPTPDAPPSGRGVLDEPIPTVKAPTDVKPPTTSGGLAPGEKEAESYTSRLLKAKKRVWEEKGGE